MSSSSSYEIVLTSSPDGPIVAYDASTGAPLTRFLGTRSPRRGLTVAGKGIIAASHVSPDTAAVSINIYNWHTSSVLHRFSSPEFVAPLAATQDGGFIFAGGQSGSIHCFSVPSGHVVNSFPAHAKPISCLQLSHDGSLVISGSDDGSIMVIPTFKIAESSSSAAAASSLESKDKMIVQHMKKAHSDSVTALSTSITLGLCTNNNSMLVSSSLDSTCKFWNLLEGTLLLTVSFPCPINGLTIPSSSSSSSSLILFAAGSDGSVYKASIIAKNRRETQNQEEEEEEKEHVVVKKWENRTHVGPTESVVVVNGGRNLVSAGEDGSVWMWDIETEQVTMVMKDDNSNSNSNGGLLMEGLSSSISDMIVVVSDGNDEYTRGRGSGGNSSNNNRYVSSGKLLKEEVVREMKKMVEVGNVLREVEEDERRAIKMLENAIAMYEKLLELILEYALKGAFFNDDDEEEETDEGENEKEDEDGKGK